MGSIGSIGYREIFEKAGRQLETKGIPVCMDFGPALAPADFEPFEKLWGVVVPSSLRQFFLEVGNGLTFRWFLDQSDPAQPFCSLAVPPLPGLQRGLEYLRMLNKCLVGHDFLESQEPEAAKRHYRRQLSFFPFLEDNADLICIESAGEQESVVFHDHEWSFYKSGDSGIRLAESLSKFWLGWASVGFVEPARYWWPDTVRQGK